MDPATPNPPAPAASRWKDFVGQLPAPFKYLLGLIRPEDFWLAIWVTAIQVTLLWLLWTLSGLGGDKVREVAISTVAISNPFSEAVYQRTLKGNQSLLDKTVFGGGRVDSGYAVFAQLPGSGGWKSSEVFFVARPEQRTVFHYKAESRTDGAGIAYLVVDGIGDKQIKLNVKTTRPQVVDLTSIVGDPAGKDNGVIHDLYVRGEGFDDNALVTVTGVIVVSNVKDPQ